MCVSKKKRPLKTTKSSSSSSITTTTTKKASRLFSGERERVFVVAKRFVTTMKNWRQQIRLHFSNSIIYSMYYIYPKTKRERACRLRARTRKRGEPRDAAKRRRQQQHHHHHRFRRRERKRRSETSSCVIISIHTIYTCFLCNGFSNRAMMRCTRERREYVSQNVFR